jgi:asparagine synthase (glutamine-hydrolysing)
MLALWRDGKPNCPDGVPPSVRSRWGKGPKTDTDTPPLGIAPVAEVDAALEAVTPLMDEALGLSVAIDGFIDNRGSLAIELGRRADGHGAADDARLILAAWKRWGEDGLRRLQGPFALVLSDRRVGCEPRIVLYREPLGRCGLHYVATSRALLVASEPSALLAQPLVSPEPDEHWLTHHFALSRPTDNRSPFRDIRKLLPGQCLVWTPNAVRLHREPLPDGRQQTRYRNEADYAEQFLALLDQAVERALIDGGDQLGIMLSGGMDSGPVAALAHRRLSASGRALTAYSWSLPEHSGADETAEIRLCAGHVGCGLKLLPGGDEWPMRDLMAWPANPNSPLANPFRRIKLAAYRAAAKDGCRVILNAASGDDIYPHPGHRLADGWRDRRFGFVLREVARTVGICGPIGLWRDPGFRGLGRHLLGWSGRPRSAPPWLSPKAARIWREAGPAWPPESADHPRPDHFRAALDQWAADGLSEETFFASRCGVDRRDPYRDLDLIDFMLSIPSDVCYRDGHTKWLARESMRGLLPESIRLRPRGGLLTEFFDAGYRREHASLRQLLTGRDVAWPDYVDHGWLMRALDAREPSEREKLLVWYCASFELWRQALSGEHPELLQFARGEA